MQGSKPLSIACAWLLAGAANAAPQAVSRIAQLPAEVVAVREEMWPISEPGGPFNPSDVIDTDHPVPGQHLVSGQASPDLIRLTVEKGGLSSAVMKFARVDGHWQLVSQERRAPDGER
ncbi:hypothetical protein [Massilia sp. S19_KUP03_FR1]|uniref:hypothetical protein n=1 Tax=Massilia sp. S19_KUP03_FR1 TaxID=3025503 RepID=UPI002FCD7978